METISKLIVALAVIAGFSFARQSNDVMVFTFRANSGEHFTQFLQSAEQFNYVVKILDSTCSSGSDSEKPALLKTALEEYQVSENLLVLYVDSYDMLLLTDPEDLIDRFRSFHAKVVFSAQAELLNASLEVQYPFVKENESRYLSSGGFVGFANDIYTMLHESLEVFGSDSRQMTFTQVFLNPMRRATLGIKLDTKSHIFQNLVGASDEIILQFKSTTETVLYNSKMDSHPAVLMGNIQTLNEFNYLSNYIPNRWTLEQGCTWCTKEQIALTDQKVEEYPIIMMAIFIEFPTPFVEEFFENVYGLTYPKSRIDLFIHKATKMHEDEVNTFVNKHASEYRSFQLHNSSTVDGEFDARILSVNQCLTKSCDYYFALDGIVQLENTSVLQHLISTNRSFVAPMLARPGKLWSNFWGALTSDGYYARSEDYVDIIGYKIQGLWHVPFVTNAYMIKAKHAQLFTKLEPEGLDIDMAFCKTLRDNGVFMYVDNSVYHGHLVEADTYETTHLHNDMYEIFTNRYTWEKKYISKDYLHYLNNVPWEQIEQPCPDVFWMPLASKKLCRDIIEEMEHFGKWSGGKHEDERLQGGYENVPTVDIHTNQIGWENHWLLILREYVKPLNTKVFEGYVSESRAIMNFVVRYRPGEQDRLGPHHDASTYTINVALNRPEIDYTGGGPRFLRYNCSVTNMRLGWMLMHPGRLTHIHEGLPVTNGTRYIMVSFIDP